MKKSMRWKNFQDSQAYFQAMAKLYKKPYKNCKGEGFDKSIHPGTKKKIVA